MPSHLVLIYFIGVSQQYWSAHKLKSAIRRGGTALSRQAIARDRPKTGIAAMSTSLTVPFSHGGISVWMS
jgi:hypothetical protein